MSDKSFNRLLVEEVYGEQRHRSVTDGFMRSCLDVIGVHTRGQPMKSHELVALCIANGLDFVEDDRDGGGPIVDR